MGKTWRKLWISPVTLQLWQVTLVAATLCLVDGKPNRKCGEIATIYQLQTVLSEIETIINNRLLTHVSDICEDTETLIPSDFLIRKYNNGSNSFLKTEEADLTL